jgi:tetratricopeptide (TPR) repeat protein
MLGILLVVILALWLTFLYPLVRRKDAEAPRSARYDMQMKKLWSAAQTSMRDHKPLRAEKALLTILKFDEKNAAAYNRLGILYAKEQKFDEAIECFEIAQSLDNNPSSLHNVGLIYLETGAYEKAVMAFEQAIELENDVPARFIALAKARERLGQIKGAVDALESAYELDHSTNTLRQILAIHEATGDTEALADVTARIEAQIAENAMTKTHAKRSRTSTSTRRPTAKRSAQSGTRTRKQI